MWHAGVEEGQMGSVGVRVDLVVDIVMIIGNSWL